MKRPVMSESLIVLFCDRRTSRSARKMKMLLLLLLSSAVAMAHDVALQEFSTGNNLFSAAIYREAAKENSGNFLVSPFSIQTVLALTQSGAKDDTAGEIRAALLLPTDDRTQSLYASLLPKLKGSDQYALHTANKIYVKDGFTLNEGFKRIAANVYQSEIENIDFSQPNPAANSINSWVERQTENKIRNLINPDILSSDTRLILINALYFKGKWTNPFEPYATSKRNFYKSANEVVKVDTMHNVELYNYYESPELNAKFLELPYEGNDVSMVIVLPNEKEGLPALEAQLERVFTTPKFTPERVRVSLPKFTIENNVPLKKILQNLGMTKAFSDRADFSGIAGEKGDLAISDVLQKAFINVTETGTEAAAATAVSVVVTLSLPIEHRGAKDFNADHPFLFYLRLMPKNLILFVGKYKNV